MKLSFKFFFTAYIIVLLSTGLGGAYIINSINDTLWDTRVEQVNTAANYAADSFLSFSDISYGEISESRRSDITRQIKNVIGGTVTDFEIYTEETVGEEFTQLEDNQTATKFTEEQGLLTMRSVYKLNTESGVYYLAVFSDFSDIQNQRNRFWKSYGIVVFGISAVSGLLLFGLTKRITNPLKRLTKVTDEIALGNYGKKVDIKSSDHEINALSESFNSMSAAVEQKIREIKEESRKRDIFVADFTHELKTPMTAIIGYAQMIRSYELDDEERTEAAQAIYNEAKRLEKLSLQLLELYVYQNEKIELEKLNLSSVGEQLKATLKYLSLKYNVSFSVDLGNEVIFANNVLLLSLLYNLADNAFKASEPQGKVMIYSISQKGLVWIFVTDNGRGIAKENIKLLTEPFYREDKSRSRKLGGAGLGLALCKEIALLHGTELSFESEKDKGTTVSFILKKAVKK